MRGIIATDAELERLPRHAQDILSLVWLGLDYLSLSATLSVPLGTVRSRLHRARARVVAMRAAQAVR